MIDWFIAQRIAGTSPATGDAGLPTVDLARWPRSQRSAWWPTRARASASAAAARGHQPP